MNRTRNLNSEQFQILLDTTFVVEDVAEDEDVLAAYIFHIKAYIKNVKLDIRRKVNRIFTIDPGFNKRAKAMQRWKIFMAMEEINIQRHTAFIQLMLSPTAQLKLSVEQFHSWFSAPFTWGPPFYFCAFMNIMLSEDRNRYQYIELAETLQLQKPMSRILIGTDIIMLFLNDNNNRWEQFKWKQGLSMCWNTVMRAFDDMFWNLENLNLMNQLDLFHKVEMKVDLQMSLERLIDQMPDNLLELFGGWDNGPMNINDPELICNWLPILIDDTDDEERMRLVNFI